MPIDSDINPFKRLHNRFRACHRFEKLSGEEFKQTIDIWERQVLKLPIASNLSRPKMMKVLGQTTGGYMGLLDMILREAAIRSLKKGLHKIDFDTLKAVAEKYR
jgi:hypothetical protein